MAAFLSQTSLSNDVASHCEQNNDHQDLTPGAIAFSRRDMNSCQNIHTSIIKKMLELPFLRYFERQYWWHARDLPVPADVLLDRVLGEHDLVMNYYCPDG